MTLQAEAPSPTDRQLVEAVARNGDAVAFELLFHRYQRPLFGFIRRQVGGRSEAEDVFQQTALRIFDGIGSCKDPNAFRAWAFGIAANLCRDEARRHHARPEPTPAETLNARAATAPSPEAQTASSQVRDQVARALDALEPRQREVFVLYHYTRLSYEEIAAAVDAPLGTVKSRMNAALTSLRPLLVGLQEA